MRTHTSFVQAQRPAPATDGAVNMSGKMLGVLLALSFASTAAMAQQAYVDIEQRLTAEQRHATGQ